MTRVRFITAITVAAAVGRDLVDVVPKDGVSTPYLAFEWHVVEALARRERYGLPTAALQRVPGINKARAVVASGGHLSASAYLKVPKVFGFVGIYKRLARSLELIDERIELQSAGDALVRAWERDVGLTGFTDRRRGTKGGSFAAELRSAIYAALVAGEVTRPGNSALWSRLVDALRPDSIGTTEGSTLRRALLDRSEPMRAELVQALTRLAPAGEDDLLRQVMTVASPDLRKRLQAIDAYERVSELLMVALDAVRYRSTLAGLRTLDPEELALDPCIRQATRELPAAFRRALRCLAKVGTHANRFDAELGRFESPLAPDQFIQELMDHHDRVQRAKPPGKRPWFDESAGGYCVRPAYELRVEPEILRRYVHPYRAAAIRSFLVDLG
jgi:hypothetical protein